MKESPYFLNKVVFRHEMGKITDSVFFLGIKLNSYKILICKLYFTSTISKLHMDETRY